MFKQMFSTVVRSIRKAFQGQPAAKKPIANLNVEQLEQRDVPATLASVANVVVANVRNDAAVLVQHAAYIESVQPTLGVSAIASDLRGLASAVRYGTVNAIFANEGKLLNDLGTEARLGSLYHRTALLNYTAIQNDYVRVIQDSMVVNQLLAVARQYSTPSVPTSIFSSGTISGDLQSALASQYNYALTHFNSSTPSNYNSYLSAQEGVIASNAYFSQVLSHTNLGGVS